MSNDDIELLCNLFYWDYADMHARYQALRVLLTYREPATPIPTFDDFAAGRVR